MKKATSDMAGFLFCGTSKKPFLVLTHPVTEEVTIALSPLTQTHASTKDILGEELVILGVEYNNNRLFNTKNNIVLSTVVLVGLKKDAGLTRMLTIESLWQENGNVLQSVRDAFPEQHEMVA